MPKSLVAFLLVAVAATAANADPAKRLVVHEWGVWKVHGPGDEPLHLAELARENPPFVRRAAAPASTQPSPVENRPKPVKKPVLFFYAAQPLHVEVAVQLVGGYPLFYYPPAVVAGDTLTFSLDVGGDTKGALHPVAKNHFWQTLRDVGATHVATGDEHEAFAFYDGPTTLRRDARATFDAAHHQVTIALETGDEVWLTDGKHATGASSKSGRTTVAWPPTQPIAMLFAALEKRLLESGLSPAETRAFLDTWRPDLTAKGMRAISIVSRAHYDAMLPIRITPTPDELVRTGVIIDEL